MSTLFETEPVHQSRNTEPVRQASSSEASTRLKALTTAVRVSLHWFTARKTLTSDQKSQAAEPFGADGGLLSAGKKLLDTKHPAWKDLTSVRGRILAHWRDSTLPYPDPGIRLIRQDRIAEFDTKMRAFQDELARAVSNLDLSYGELKQMARDRLGDLYNPDDYPATLEEMFAVEWDFPSVEPPDYLRQLHPDIYRQECQRVRDRFGEAVRLAEVAFTEELSKLISHLTERLSGTEDGKPKVFRDSAVTNLTEFFQRFRELNIGSNDQLEQLVTDAQGIIRGVQPQSLRQDVSTRREVATELSRVQSVLDGLMIDRPRRNLLRKPK